MKVIVVGSSHGGYETMRGLKLEAPETEIQWYEQGDFLSFLSCGMQLYLEGVVKHVDDVSYAKKDEWEQQGVQVNLEQQITQINADKHEVQVLDLKTNQTRTEKYDKLLLAVGAVPFDLPIPGTDLANIYAMRGRNWAIKLKEKTVDPQTKNVAVIGSGYIGVEAAEVFAKAGMNVTLIDMIDRPLGLYLDQEFTDILSQHMEDNGIHLHLGASVQEFIGEDGKVTAVQTDKGTVPADLVIQAAGIRPNTNWLKDVVALDEKGLVKIDQHLTTSQPDIYAVGDATLVPFAPTDTPARIALATNARRQGRIAAKNILGQETAMVGVSGSSGLPVFDYKFASTGIKEGTAQNFDVEIASVYVESPARPPFVPEEAGNAPVYFKLTYEVGTKRIVGAQIMSKLDVTANINVISLAIQAKLTLDDLAYCDFFFQPGFDRPWNIINIAAQRALAAQK